MPFAFEKRVVYQTTVSFADACRSLTRGFPCSYLFLAYELNRAALSIASNIADGKWPLHEAGSKKTFSGSFGGSVHACVPLFELAA
jgi:four helix bundle protein